MSDLKSARIGLEKKIKNDPEDIDARLSLAKIHMDEKDPTAAIPLYTDILNLDPENAEAYMGLGLAWGMSILENIPAVELHGDEVDEEELLNNSIQFLERSIELDPENTTSLNALARLYIVQSLEEEAVDMFKQSLLIDQAQHEVLEELQKLTGTPVWQLLEKDVYMGDFEE
ncbi:MAG TPA: tetratricopeptide repeat protein [Candidatus Sabulitectum sp.]|nr:tetratricopeptide repeat protein [Candidatus Sabulitectum sp.]HPJ28121.1 tetratricopeptide repeat protein [Candidatus Sabulitectum sp.]HPR22099.1 tetratricopeptide repeat protein [Candidatus Sabulitectum sp.]HRW77705.1 tetratricopeptide repeat protein [Candidatus Sabulitectum sp.]